jgi:hypothetical protein
MRAPMAPLRALLRSHRRLAALLLALALCMKALVPAGYMVGGSMVDGGAKVLTIEICADTLGAKLTRQIAVPHHAAPGDAQGDHGKSAAACPYAGLAMAGLAGVDTALLALALGFILALGFAPVPPPRLARAAYFRPPLRGPPGRF